MRNQKGFTLIELIIVIVVLGILAVTAAPQFIDFASDARASTVKGLKGAINGTSQTVNARAAIEGELDATGTLDNGVTLAWGYPDASATGLQDAMQIDTGDWQIIVGSGTAGVDEPGDDVIAFAPEGFTITGYNFGTPASSASGTRCVVTYAEASAEGEQPTVTVDDTDC